MVTDDPGVNPDLLSLVPLLWVVVQQPEDEVLGRAGDVLPLLLGEIDPALLYVGEELSLVLGLERGFPTEPR